MTNNNFKIEYLFINFHDNDFFMEMCNSAELIIDSFNKELLVRNLKANNYQRLLIN